MNTLEPEVLEQTKVETSTELEVPTRVIVHNDPVNTFEYVTYVLKKLFNFTTKLAEEHTLRIHTEQRSVVWEGKKERAEYYLMELQKYQLTASIES